MKSHNPAQRVIASSLLVSMLGLTTFGPQALAQQAPAYTPPAPAPAPVAYTPPTAEQLYQMVAPIALFPDQLVALVLAGSTYPDQVTAANELVTQNPNLTGASLVSTADQQPWDPSIKALTGFPAVLSQMNSNMAWTTALGQAYYNDPTDVLNAVQVMRQRAQAAGHLRSTPQMVVTTAAPAAVPAYVPAPDAPVVYDGPVIVAPPPETIVIAPARPDVVYVPSYNPAVVYGAPIPVYPGYVYAPPVFAPGIGISVGVFTFGVGIAVGAALFGHVGWGWHNWGMQWAPPPYGGPGGPGGWRPAVVYNHTTYISRTNNTVINQYNHTSNNYGGPAHGAPMPMREQQQQMRAQQMHAPQPGAQPGAHPGAMTMPHFNANDSHPGARPTPQAAPGHAPAINRAAAPAAHNAAPQFEHSGAAHAPMQATHPQMQQHEAMPRAAAPHHAETHPQNHPQAHPQPHPEAVRHAPHPEAARPAPHPEAARPAPHQASHPAQHQHREDEHK